MYSVTNKTFNNIPSIKLSNNMFNTSKKIILGMLLSVLITPAMADGTEQNVTSQTEVIDTNKVNKNNGKITLQRKGITVWEAPVANSKMLGFKAQAVFNAPIRRIFATIQDVKNASEWVPNTKQVALIENPSFDKSTSIRTGKAKLYFIISMPFPLTNRDLVVSSKFTQDEQGNITIENFSAKDKRFPVNDKYIRIHEYKGAWYLEKISDNKTRVTLSGHADPAGGIPSWVANMFVTQQPYDMMINMRKQITNKRYDNVKVPFLD